MSSIFRPESLSGDNGFNVTGVPSGADINAIGDINGDGFQDFAIFQGSLNTDAFIIFGSDGERPASFDLNTLAEEGGFTIAGDIDFVSGAGDINDDGIDDFIVGVVPPFFAGEPGTSYVLYGNASGFPTSIAIDDITADQGFAVQSGVVRDFGVTVFDEFGATSASVGDVNGDGIEDFAIGAPGQSKVYVLFGDANGFPSNIDVNDLDGTNGFVVEQPSPTGDLGTSIAAAGDLNGDGIDDFIIGAPNSRPGDLSQEGAAYVVFGSQDGFSSSLSVDDLNGENGFAIVGSEEAALLGTAVAGGADVNGDGIDDIIVGAPARVNSLNPVEGSAFIVYGTPTGFASTVNVSNLDGTNGFRLDGAFPSDHLGSSVALGDVNGDGVADIYVGTVSGRGPADTDGESYLVFGSTETFPAILNAANLDGTIGFSILGNTETGFLGELVALADTNGDGFADLLVTNRTDEEVSVIFGVSNIFQSVTEVGTDGDDELTGSSFDDTLRGEGGNDTLNGEGGNDLLVGGPGADLIFAGPGNDVVDIGEGDVSGDTINGGSGDDELFGGPGNDVIAGDDGNDLLDGGLDDDTLQGGEGDDLLLGREAEDVLRGGAGNDTLVGGEGTGDTLDGGEGFDWADYSDSEGELSVSLLSGTGTRGDAFGDTLINIEGIRGSAFNDTLVGSDASDIIFSNLGDDYVDARAGDDELSGGSGDDTLIGGDGNDRLVDGIGLNRLSGGNGNDSLLGGFSGTTIAEGGGGADFLRSYDGSDILVGGNIRGDDIADSTEADGHDSLFGHDGNDTLIGGDWSDSDQDGQFDVGEEVQEDPSRNSAYGGGGDDLIFGDAGSDDLGGGTGIDTISGGVGRDTLYGGEASDSVSGGGGQDILFGGDGDDQLDGGAGSDRLFGGAGDDTLAGGSGADRFFFATGHGADVITDFEASSDQLYLVNTATDFADLAAVVAASSETTVDGQAGILIDTGGGDSLFLSGLGLNDLTGSNLIL